MANAVDGSGVAAAARTLSGAFFHDPMWSWVFDDPDRRFEQYERMATVFVGGAIEHGWVRATSGFEAVALWIPPGCAELSDADNARLDGMLDDLVGPRAELLREIFECFEVTHPHDEEHYYLSFLGTDPEHRGGGIGMQLLRENLAEIDRAHEPAYLESTNPANLARYESVGFRRTGEFALPGGGPSITTMWRPAAG